MSAAIPPREAELAQLIERHRGRPGALLPLLHDVQHAFGHVPADLVPAIAQALNLSRAEVHGVITYYHHFRTEAPPERVLQVCRAEACRTMGGERLLAHARERLGCADGATRSADGRWAVEPVYCLGLCATSPAVLVGEEPHARMTPARLDALMAVAVPA